MTDISVKGEIGRKTHTEEECHMKMKAKIWVMSQKLRDAKIASEPAEHRRQACNRLAFTGLRRH